jgi:hypothetical protein
MLLGGPQRIRGLSIFSIDQERRSFLILGLTIRVAVCLF